ncbi:hypothetical protein [Pseudomonas cichorii]|uniref:hypothetical protein n=1 Tax=Pseudomonas cichorii TaxID=36746 RepID=UPI00191056EF|nr:hypothetical protein [Pseudomonas cichorii]
MIVVYLLYAVLVVYTLPLGFSMLYAWLMSTKNGVRYELRFAEASKTFRHVMLFGTLFGVVLFPVDYFLPETPAFNLYVCAQLLLLIVCTIRLSCLAVILPLGEHATGARLAYGTRLAIVILVCQPALYIGWAILR